MFGKGVPIYNQNLLEKVMGKHNKGKNDDYRRLNMDEVVGIPQLSSPTYLADDGYFHDSFQRPGNGLILFNSRNDIIKRA